MPNKARRVQYTSMQGLDAVRQNVQIRRNTSETRSTTGGKSRWSDRPVSFGEDILIDRDLFCAARVAYLHSSSGRNSRLYSILRRLHEFLVVSNSIQNSSRRNERR